MEIKTIEENGLANDYYQKTYNYDDYQGLSFRFPSKKLDQLQQKEPEGEEGMTLAQYIEGLSYVIMCLYIPLAVLAAVVVFTQSQILKQTVKVLEYYGYN